MQQTFAAQSCPAFYADNEPKSALARDLGDCRDNKGKLAKRVFTCYLETVVVHGRKFLN